MGHFKSNEQKICFFCHSKSVKKDGKVSPSTIRRKPDTLHSTRIVSSDKHVVVLMDTTYWGWKFGVVLFKDARTGKILWRKFIRRKKIRADYQNWLLYNGFRIDGVVCDGLRGMFQMFARYKVQMCQFHQIKIVKKYLAGRPELPASQELLELAYLLCHTDKESFVGAFDEWSDRWSVFLKERSIDTKTEKSHYVHRRVRSTYLSIKRNMPYLWTWYDNIDTGIPNTNNGLEGKFADLKSKLRNYNGLSIKHRMIFIDAYFKGSYK